MRAAICLGLVITFAVAPVLGGAWAPDCPMAADAREAEGSKAPQCPLGACSNPDTPEKENEQDPEQRSCETMRCCCMMFWMQACEDPTHVSSANFFPEPAILTPVELDVDIPTPPPRS